MCSYSRVAMCGCSASGYVRLFREWLYAIVPRVAICNCSASGYVQLFVSGYVQFIKVAALIHFGIQIEDNADGFGVARDLD
jgi:hypothetical protein